MFDSIIKIEVQLIILVILKFSVVLLFALKQGEIFVILELVEPQQEEGEEYIEEYSFSFSSSLQEHPSTFVLSFV